MPCQVRINSCTHNMHEPKHMHTGTHKYIRRPVHMYTHIHTCAHRHTQVHIHTLTCVRVHMHIACLKLPEPVILL